MARTFPFPLPNGWFQIAYSDEIAPGGTDRLRYFGEDLVLSRADDGAPALRDRRAVTLPLCERAGILWLWRHADGAPPAWPLPEIPEADAWGPPARFRWTIRTRNQEMGENAVDRAHFRYVHGTATVPDSDVTIAGPVRRAVQRVKLTTPRGVVDGCIASEAFGLGCSVTRFSGICETVLVGSSTPIDEERVDTRFSFFQKKVDGGGRVGAAVIRDIVKQMGEDIPIWENKVYLARPLLCDGDGPIMQYRRWAAQFYTLSRELS